MWYSIFLFGLVVLNIVFIFGNVLLYLWKLMLVVLGGMICNKNKFVILFWK